MSRTLKKELTKEYTSHKSLGVVSLSQSITDILINLCAPPLNPHWWQVDLSAAEIAEYQPVTIVCEPVSLQLAKRAQIIMEQAGQKIPEIIVCQADSLGSGIASIRKLGRLIGAEGKAMDIISRENGYLKIAKAKAQLGCSGISEKPKCLTVIDFQHDSSDARNFRLLACGIDSFQAKILELVGGVTAGFAKENKNPENWIDAEAVASFAPDFLFTTKTKLESRLTKYLADTVASKIPAVTNGKILSFPEEMLGQFSCSYGYISLWLASTLYPEVFADRQGLLQDDSILSSQKIALPENLGICATLSTARLYDLPARTIILHSSSPRQILSSLHGWRNGISWIGNHECPHPAWPLLAKMGMEETNRRVLEMHGLTDAETCLLHTGADISLFALSTKESGPYTVTALATAGVLFNALRAGCDSGKFVEAGTINLILLTNASLSQECMVQCLVQATEAKVAALQSLDIRSCQSGLQATGTGTDNCIVVSGTGLPATMAGGHTRLGELMAKASYSAVREAICRQHGFGPDRPLPQRLAERGIFWRSANLRALEKNRDAQAAISAFLAVEDPARHGLVAERNHLLNWLEKLAESYGIGGQDLADLIFSDKAG